MSQKYNVQQPLIETPIFLETAHIRHFRLFGSLHVERHRE